MEIDRYLSEEVFDALETAIDDEGSDRWRAASSALAVLWDFHTHPEWLEGQEVVLGDDTVPPTVDFHAWTGEGHALLIARPAPGIPFLAIWFGRLPPAGRWRMLVAQRKALWHR